MLSIHQTYSSLWLPAEHCVTLCYFRSGRMASVVHWQVCAFHTGWRKSNPEISLAHLLLIQNVASCLRSPALTRELVLWQVSCVSSIEARMLARKPRCRKHSQLVALLLVGIQLCIATCCSGAYTLRLVSKWKKEVAAHEPQTVTSIPNGTDFFWWTVPPLLERLHRFLWNLVGMM